MDGFSLFRVSTWVWRKPANTTETAVATGEMGRPPLWFCAKKTKMKAGGCELGVCMGADIIIYLFYGVLAYSCVAAWCSSSPFSLFVCLLWLAERSHMNRPRDAPDYLRGATEARGSARRVSRFLWGRYLSLSLHACVCGRLSSSAHSCLLWVRLCPRAAL